MRPFQHGGCGRARPHHPPRSYEQTHSDFSLSRSPRQSSAIGTRKVVADHQVREVQISHESCDSLTRTALKIRCSEPMMKLTDGEMLQVGVPIFVPCCAPGHENGATIVPSIVNCSRRCSCQAAPLNSSGFSPSANARQPAPSARTDISRPREIST